MRERWLGLDKFMSIPALNTPSSQRTLGPRSKSTGVCNLGSSFRWHDVFLKGGHELFFSPGGRSGRSLYKLLSA
jgi:hypothetical protein